MKILFASAFLIIAFLCVLSSVAATSSAVSGCHNATGSCTKTHFMCANEEAIPHSKRCDGVEDCADGTDEYMCDLPHTDKPYYADMTVAQRTAFTEASCIKCTCLKGSITVASSDAAWFKIALTSPRDLSLMTSAPSKQNKPCNPAATTEIILNVYKKRNKGCRGWVCCFRQSSCKTCSSNAPANNCYP